MTETKVGALVGWRRERTTNGVVFKLQLAHTSEAWQTRGFDVAIMSLNDRQLRSFARDVTRAAEERGIELRPKRKRWFLFDS